MRRSISILTMSWLLMTGSFAFAQAITDDQVFQEMSDYLHALNGSEVTSERFEQQLTFLKTIKELWKLDTFRKLQQKTLEEILTSEKLNSYYRIALAFDREDIEHFLTKPHTQIHLTSEDHDLINRVVQFRNGLRAMGRDYELLKKTGISGRAFQNSMSLYRTRDIVNPMTILNVVSYDSLCKEPSLWMSIFTIDPSNQMTMKNEEHLETSPGRYPLLVSNEVDQIKIGRTYADLNLFTTIQGNLYVEYGASNQSRMKQFLLYDNGFIRSIDASLLSTLNTSLKISSIIAALSENGTIHLWGVYEQMYPQYTHFDELTSPDLGKYFSPQVIAISPLGFLMVSGFHKQTGISYTQRFKWNDEKKTFVRDAAFEHPSPARSLHVSPDGRFVFVGLDNGHIQVLDLVQDELSDITPPIDVGRGGYPTALLIENDTVRAAGYSNGTVVFFAQSDLERDITLPILNSDKNESAIIDLLYDGTDLLYDGTDLLFTLSQNGNLHFWKLNYSKPDLSLIGLIDPTTIRTAAGGGGK